MTGKLKHLTTLPADGKRAKPVGEPLSNFRQYATSYYGSVGGIARRYARELGLNIGTDVNAWSDSGGENGGLQLYWWTSREKARRQPDSLKREAPDVSYRTADMSNRTGIRTMREAARNSRFARRPINDDTSGEPIKPFYSFHHEPDGEATPDYEAFGKVVPQRAEGSVITCDYTVEDIEVGIPRGPGMGTRIDNLLGLKARVYRLADGERTIGDIVDQLPLIHRRHRERCITDVHRAIEYLKTEGAME